MIQLNHTIFKLHKISGIGKQYDVNQLTDYTNRPGKLKYPYYAVLPVIPTIYRIKMTFVVVYVVLDGIICPGFDQLLPDLREF